MPININGTTGIDSPGFTQDGDPVVESGSNTDGEWTKWADGTQICTRDSNGTLSATIQPTGTDDSRVWFSPGSTLQFPALFTAVPRVTLGTESITGNVAWVGTDSLVDTTEVKSVRLIASGPGASGVVSVTATGRWK